MFGKKKSVESITSSLSSMTGELTEFADAKRSEHERFAKKAQQDAYFANCALDEAKRAEQVAKNLGAILN